MKRGFSLITTWVLLACSGVTAATHYVSLQSTNPMPPYETWGTAATNIQQAVDEAGSGDRVVVTNGEYSGCVTVTNPLVLSSVNGPEVTIINGGGVTRCAFLLDGASLTGFTLTNGEALAVDFDQMIFGGGGAVWCATTNVFITNCIVTGCIAQKCPGGGVYKGTLYDCTLRGNGVVSPAGIRLSGGGACGSTLHNCKLERNSADYGGGASASILFNCALVGNAAWVCGGAEGCTLYNCTLTANTSMGNGGAADSTLYNCTLVGNYSETGTAVVYSALYNCISYSNISSFGESNYGDHCAFDHSCTRPLPLTGIGNITNMPLFVDCENNDLRLQSNSPCINAGNNAFVTTPTDMDGKPRIVSGSVDMGAYEYQGAGSIVSYAWLQQYGFATDGSADTLDFDGDGHSNWQEWICGTCPTNKMSVLRVLSASRLGEGVTVVWQSVEGMNYSLGRSTNLSTPPNFKCIAMDVLGKPGITSYSDTNVPAKGPIFYRVGVQYP